MQRFRLITAALSIDVDETLLQQYLERVGSPELRWTTISDVPGGNQAVIAHVVAVQPIATAQ